MKTISEFLYLNLYSILLFCTTILVFGIPLYHISFFFIPVQIVAGLFTLSISMRLFGSYNEKRRMMNILMQRNSRIFHATSFEPYMKAPCSRLIVKSVLWKIGKKDRYRELRIYRLSLQQTCKNNLATRETKITYGEGFYNE